MNITDDIAQKITEEAKRFCADCQECNCYECEYRYWREVTE